MMASLENIYFLQLKDLVINNQKYNRGSLLQLIGPRCSKVEEGHPLLLEFCDMNEGASRQQINLDYHTYCLKQLNDVDFRLLLPIRESMRCRVCFDCEWMEEGRTIKLGDDVTILKLLEDSKVSGFVRYIGDLHEPIRATYFGIELDSKYAGKGSSDGFFRMQRFYCQDNCAVFRDLSKIRLVRRTSEVAQIASIPEARTVSPMHVHEDAEKEQSEIENPLKETQTLHIGSAGERSILSKDMHAKEQEEYVENKKGKEFDNLCKDTQYFHVKKDHASFGSHSRLIQANDYQGASKSFHNLTRSQNLEAVDCYAIDWRDELTTDSTQSTTDTEIRPSETVKSLSDFEPLDNFMGIVHIASLILGSQNCPISMKTELKATNVRDALMLFLNNIHESMKTGLCNRENITNLKHIIEWIKPDLKELGDESTMRFSLNLFRACFGDSSIKMAMIPPLVKYDYLHKVLKESDDIDLFSNHFDEAYIYMVSMKYTNKNTVIPSLTMDLSSIFFSCRECEKVFSDEQEGSSKQTSLVCEDCMKKYQSYRSSIFCEECFEFFHQNCNMLHENKHKMDTAKFQEETEFKHFQHSKSKTKRDSFKMELFAFISSVSDNVKVYYKSEEENLWYVIEGVGSVLPEPKLENFFNDYMTSPSSSYGSDLQKMLDGIRICYYRLCT